MKHYLLIAASLFATARAATPEPRMSTEWRIEERIKIGLEELKNLEWKAGMKLPEGILALDGKEVEIEGYMNIGTPEGVETFQLVADSCGCDGRGKPHHFVEVTLDEETTTFNPDLITVHGTFEVGEVVEDGFVVSLFRLKTATIQ